MDREFQLEIGATAERTLAAVDEAAEMWDAVWEAAPGGGRLHLPVLAGIRSGSVLARVEVSESTGGSLLVLQVEDSAYRVNRPAALLLALGAIGGIVTMLWPLFPKQLLNFVPFSLVLAIGSWLLIVSRLRTAGPDDFLENVAELADDTEEPEVESSPPAPLEP